MAFFPNRSTVASPVPMPAEATRATTTAALDLRALPMPEPMERALAAADALPPGGALSVLTPFMPMPLLEVLADRGLHGRIDAAQWRQVCEDFGRRQREGDLEAAVLAAIATLSEMLAEHFPADPDAPRDNELPDRPQLLG